MADNTRRLFPLTTCSIGIWTAVEGMRPYLLLCPDRKQFVVLLAREPDAKARRSNAGTLSVNAVLACARNYAGLWLRHKNPFIDHTPEPSDDTAVLTFEVAFSEVVGMDFRWPLTDEPRLVLEASCVCKRVFDTVDDVCAHYPPVRYRRLRGNTFGISADQQQQQQAQAKQRPQQQQGSDAAAGASGMMSRVPSWASWASWTIGSVRGSFEVTCTPTAAAAAAAATDMPGTACDRVLAENGTATAAVAAPATDSDAAAGDVAGGGSVLISGQDPRPGAQLGQEPSPGTSSSMQPSEQQGTATDQQLQLQEAAGVSLPRRRTTSSGSGASVSRLGPSCGLDSMVSLSQGMAGSAALLAAAAAAAAVHGEAPGDACSEQPCSQPVLPLLPVRLSSRGTHSRRGSLRSSDPGSDRRVLAVPSRQHTPSISPALSGASTPNGVAACSESGLSEHAALLDGALAEASFGFWQQQRHQQQDDDQHSLQGGSAPGCYGAAASPCSMPCSPRQSRKQPSSSPEFGSAVGCTADRAADCAAAGVQATGQPLVRADQPHEQCQQHGLRRAGHASSGGGKRGSKSRLSASVDTSCPLCRQALTQPHDVLQQRFHQQLEQRHVRLATAAAHSSTKGSKAAMFARSRSACSLQQLQQLQQQERECAGAGADCGAATGLTVQVPQQQPQPQQQEQPSDRSSRRPLSPRSFAGLAAAAIGVLAARCRPADLLGSKQQQPALQLHDSRTLGECDETGVDAAADPACVEATSSRSCLQPQLQGAAGTEAVEAETGLGAAKGSNPVLVVSAHADTSSSDDNLVASSGHHAHRDACSRDTAAATTTTTAAAAAAAVTATKQVCGVACAQPATPVDGCSAVSDALPAVVVSPPADAAAHVCKVATVPSAAQAEKEPGGVAISREAVYSNRTIVLTFTDPTLPYQLSKLVKNPSNVHLLKLYESGLPAWAVVLPSYGLWYRPWLRKVTWLLFVLLSVVSMAMGFYDLWKNVPYFKQFVVSMFRPAAAVFEWLEGHTQIRLSILLTYMLGKSQLLVQLVKLLADTSLQPLLAPFAPLAAFASTIAEGTAWLLQPFVEAARVVFGPLGRLAWVLLQLLWRLISTVLWFGPLQLLQLLGSGLMGLGQLLLLPFHALLPAGAGIRAGWTAAKATGQVARTAAPAVADAARAAAGSGAWWWWSPLEALELMRVSTVRVAKAVQAVLRFFVTLASTINKHRLSLMMQLKGKVWGGLQAAAASPAGRVASVVAHKMGQGDRLMRVQQRVAHRLRGEESLNSMGSEALVAMGPFSPAAGDGYPYRPYSRTYSIDGDSELLLESQERDDSDDDCSGEVSSSMPWQQGRSASATTARAFQSSVGLRQRAVTAAAAAAAAGAVAGPKDVQRSGSSSPFLVPSSSLLKQQHLLAASRLAELAAPGMHTAQLLGRQHEAALATGFEVGLDGGSSSSSTPSLQDPVLAAAAARAALGRSYQLPAGSFSAAAAHGVDSRGLRQSYESFASPSMAAAARGAPGPGGLGVHERPSAGWVGDGARRWNDLDLMMQQQASAGGMGWTEAAGLLMVSQRPCQNRAAAQLQPAVGAGGTAAKLQLRPH